MVKQIFVNLPVKDLDKSKAFFAALGFTFNPMFTDENAACMIMGENIYAMLLMEPFFQGFTSRTICDTTTHVEVLNAISLDSRAAVDTMVTTALAQGGREHREAQDHGWMYQRAIEDLDGHIWEVMFADESQIPAEMG